MPVQLAETLEGLHLPLQQGMVLICMGSLDILHQINSWPLQGPEALLMPKALLFSTSGTQQSSFLRSQILKGLDTQHLSNGVTFIVLVLHFKLHQSCREDQLFGLAASHRHYNSSSPLDGRGTTNS